MGWTQCHFFSPGIRDDSIYLQEYVTDPIEPGLGKLMLNTIRPNVWLVVVSWNTKEQESCNN